MRNLIRKLLGNKPKFSVNIDHDLVYCSFCCKASDQVQYTIAGGDGLYICVECVDVCNEYLEEARKQK